jgi:hypothetical protein
LASLRPNAAASLREKKLQNESIACLSTYDYAMARLLDEGGIDMILVGDSLATTMLGRETTLPVTMDEMVHHARTVRRGVRRAFLAADMPYGSYGRVVQYRQQYCPLRWNLSSAAFVGLLDEQKSAAIVSAGDDEKKRNRRPHPGRQTLPADVPRVEKVIACTPEQCVCGNCRNETVVIGYEESEVLKLKRAKYYPSELGGVQFHNVQTDAMRSRLPLSRTITVGNGRKSPSNKKEVVQPGRTNICEE